MEIVTNDMMIHDRFENKYVAIQGIKDSIQVLLELKKNTNFIRLSAAKNIFRKLEIAPDYYFEQLFSENNDLFGQKEKSILKSLFVNFSKIELQKDNFQFEGMKSAQCAWAFLNHAIVFSLPMDEKWKADRLLGILNREEKSENVEIANISLLRHIKTHGKQLGVRKYELNPKHKINVGWGTEMDLADREAQELLMLAVPTDETYSHLIAKKNGKYYSFRCHYENYYHGYWDNTMSEKYRKIVDKNFT